MVTLGLIGYGVLGRQIHKMYVTQYGVTNTFRYYDDKASMLNAEYAFPFNYWKTERDYSISYIVALGYKHLDLKTCVIHDLIAAGQTLATFIHKTAFINTDVIVKGGAIVYPMANIDTGVVLGHGVLLNNSVVVSHDSEIGDGCFLAPGVIISGNVRVGFGTFIGSGSTVSNGVIIGNNAVIGAGSCVTHDVEDGSYVIGNPMRKLQHGFSLK